MVKTLLVTTAMVLMGTAAQAVVIPDASFETPVTSSYVYNPTVTGVTFNSGSGVQRNGSAWGFANAPDGSQTAFLQSTSSYIGQIVFSLSDLTVGQAYQVIFAGSGRPTYAVDPLTVSFSGTQIGAYSITSNAWADYSTASFVATGTTSTLTFRGSPSSSDSGVGLDNVRISAVPEPASWAMMIGGFGLIGATMRRRKPSVSFG